MTDKLTKIFAFAMLTIMLVLAFFSMKGDSGTFDEVAHLPAGVSYITQKDMRLNPEHPPLIKDLAGLSILAWSKPTKTEINIPTDIKAWQENINGQWDFGNEFLYRSGNPAEEIFLAGRLPMLLILLILGIFIFVWTRQLFGNKAALLALFFFSFSPTFIAHSRYVTTDVAAAAGFFIATYCFIHYLRNRTAWNFISAAIIFGLVQLIKFSLFLLIPLFILITIIWIAIQIYLRIKIDRLPAQSPFKERVRERIIAQTRDSITKIIIRHILGLISIVVIGYALIVIPIYSYHIINYPPQKQTQDITTILNSSGSAPSGEILDSCKKSEYIKRCPREVSIWLAQKSIPARAISQYMYGLIMMLQRADGGNTTYFMGQISASGWTSYFPIMYLLKEPLALHILTLIALIAASYSLIKKRIEGIFLWLNLNFEIIAMFLIITIYWYTSVSSPLNIGVRHVLPTFAFIYVLVAASLATWLTNGSKFIRYLKFSTIGILLAWQAVTIFAIYPSYLAYYNEIIGGPRVGYKIATDSNLDWGQDLRRLADWIENYNRCAATGSPVCAGYKNPQTAKPIEKIYVDYFGGGPPERYLGEKFQPWWGEKNPADLRSGDWLAISANSLQGGRAKAINGYDKPTDYYRWLDKYEPVTVIGYSIFIYRIP